MEWAGGNEWESYVDSLAAENEKGAVKSLQKQGKMYPETWKWHGEHWKLARYVLSLPIIESIVKLLQKSSKVQLPIPS